MSTGTMTAGHSYASATANGGTTTTATDMKKSIAETTREHRRTLFSPPPTSMTLMGALLLLDSPLLPWYSRPSAQANGVTPDQEDHVFLLSRPYLQNWICWAYHQPVPPNEEERVKTALCYAAKDQSLKSPAELSLEFHDPGPIDSSSLSLLGHPLLLRPNVIVGQREGGAKEDSSFSASELAKPVPIKGRAQSFDGSKPAGASQGNSNYDSLKSPDEQVGCCAVSEGFYELLRSVHGVLCDDGQSISFQSHIDENKCKFTMHHHVLASAAAMKKSLKYRNQDAGTEVYYQAQKSSMNGQSNSPSLPDPIEFRRKVLYVPRSTISMETATNSKSPRASKLLKENEADENDRDPLIATVELYPIKFFYSIVDEDTLGPTRPSDRFLEGGNTALGRPASIAAGPTETMSSVDLPSPQQTTALLNAAVTGMSNLQINGNNNDADPIQSTSTTAFPPLGSSASASAPSSPAVSPQKLPPQPMPAASPISKSHMRGRSMSYIGTRPHHHSALAAKLTSVLPNVESQQQPKDTYPTLGFILVSRTSPIKDALAAIAKIAAPDKSSDCVRLWKKMNYGADRTTAEGDGYELLYLDDSLEGRLLELPNKNKKDKNQKEESKTEPPPPPLTVGEWTQRNDGDKGKSVSLLLETRMTPKSKWVREALELENRIKVGDFVDAQDTAGKWYEAIVRKVTEDTVTVHYVGWASRWNTTLRRYRKDGHIVGTPKAVRPPEPLWSHTSPWRENIKIGEELEVREVQSLVQRPKWFRGVVRKVANENDPPHELFCGAEVECLEDDISNSRSKSRKQQLLVLKRKRQIMVEVPQERNMAQSASMPTTAHAPEQTSFLRWVNLYGEEICKCGTHLELRNKSVPATVSYTYGNREAPVEVLKSFNNVHGAGFVRESLRGVPPAPGSVGLQNLGNSCFLNSIAQCLNHTDPLTMYFLKGDYVNDLNRKNPLGSGGRVAIAYASFLGEVWSGEFSIIAPRLLKQTVASFAPQFNNVYQHDSQEFCQFLMDGIHEDLNRVKEKPYVEELEGRGMKDEKAAIESWRKHLLRHDSIIVDNFQGMHRSHVTCPGCGRESIKFDVYSTISLPIPPDKAGTNIRLEDCLENFEIGEQLDEHNAWYCNSCKKHVCALKMIALWSVPDILVFHLKRFQFDNCKKTGGVVRSKMEDKVEFPIEKLDMSPYILGPIDEDAPPIYKLYGVSEHSGATANSGHYTATVRNSKDDKWYRYNDSHVGLTSGEASVTGGAYLLFYQRSKGTSRWGGMEKAMKEYGLNPHGSGNTDVDGFTQVKSKSRRKKGRTSHR